MDDMRKVESDPAGRQCVRRASARDVDALIGICRLGFPDSLRWQGFRPMAGDWWRTVLNTTAAQTWVCEANGTVCGLCVLVVDIDLWTREKARRREALTHVLLSSLLRPRLAAAGVAKKLAKAAGRKRDRANSPTAATSDVGTWIELIAVSPSMRGCGVGKRLLGVCEDCARELGSAALGLCVGAENEPAIRLYEASGFARLSLTGSGWVCVKRLRPPDPHTNARGVAAANDLRAAREG